MRRRRRPAEPEPQVNPKRNGKPFALASRPGRRRKTKTISSSGGAIAQPARRRGSGNGHDRLGSFRREAGGGEGAERLVSLGRSDSEDQGAGSTAVVATTNKAPGGKPGAGGAG